MRVGIFNRKGRISKLVTKYASGGKYIELRKALDLLNTSKLPEVEQEEWYVARSAAAFRVGDRVEALRFSEEGVARFPKSSQLQFSLGQEYENVGKINDAVVCFKKIRFPEISAAHLLATARYLYLWDKFSEAQNIIQPIFDKYYELGVADDTFLFIRGLPFFGEAFGFRAAFSKFLGDIDKANQELERAKRELRDYSFRSLQRVWNATLSGDWSEVIASVERYLQECKGKHSPLGYQLMLRAVLVSRRAEDTASAFRELESVQLDKNDFGWLSDVRLLAKAEIAHKYGQNQMEEDLIVSFFQRQCLMFEPHHAFDFGFLDYQETLKPRYWQTKSVAMGGNGTIISKRAGLP